MRIVRHRRVAGAVALLLVATSGGGVASAAGVPTAPLLIRQIDSSHMPTVVVDVSTLGKAVSPGSFSITENGHAEKGLTAETLAKSATPTGTVLVVDTSASMTGNQLLAADEGLRAIIAAKSPADQMAIVAYGGTPRVVQDFTADSAVLTAGLGRLGIEGEPALYSGVQMGAALLEEQPTLLPQLIVVGDADNTASGVSLQNTMSDVLGSKALTYVVGLGFTHNDLSDLQGLASAAGGSYFDTTDGASAAAAFSTIRADLADQYVLTYTSATSGAANLIVSAPGFRGAATMIPGGVASGASLNPAAVSVPQPPPFLRGKAGLLLIALLVLLCVGLAIFAVVELVSGGDNTLLRALQTYQSGSSRSEETPDAGVVQSALIKRAVATTAKLAQDRGLLQYVEEKLEQADLALRPAEAIFFWALAVIVFPILVFGLTHNAILFLFALMMVGLIPPAALSFLATRRLKKFNSQLPDTLQLLSSSLRAGFSFLQGVEAVAREVSEPMGGELRRVIVEAQLGKPVEEALQDCADRMRSPDFDWAVMAVNIQREVGGNLADLLQTVGVTMIERERLRRDVKSLTAEGRMSAIVLGIMPPALGLVFYVTNPAYIRVLFTHVGGEIALGVASVVMVLGFLWMKKIVDIKV